MADYDASHFNPPAPLARVNLRDPDSHNIVSNVPMLIDSGADITLIPRAIVDELNLRPAAVENYQLEAFDGSRSVGRAVQLDLLFLGRIVRGRYLVLDTEIGILGRDVLNHFTILLNGPALSWQEQ